MTPSVSVLFVMSMAVLKSEVPWTRVTMLTWAE